MKSIFVGQPFKLKQTLDILEGKFIGKIEMTSYHSDDPEMEKKLHDTYGENLRIILPSDMVTADYDPQRVNVYVSVKGVISEVNHG